MKQDNNNLQSRRQFFKKAAKGILPILGAIALFNVPFGLMAQEQTKHGGCKTSCSANCSYHCSYHCSYQCVVTCSTMCGNNCGGGCKMTCKYVCAKSCIETCMSGAKMRTDSISNDTTILKK